MVRPSVIQPIYCQVSGQQIDVAAAYLKIKALGQPTVKPLEQVKNAVRLSIVCAI